jgi:thiol-disulfide isomerase/thioredoxin
MTKRFLTAMTLSVAFVGVPAATFSLAEDKVQPASVQAGDEIIKQIEGLKPPMIAADKRNDPDARAEYTKLYNEFNSSRLELIAQLTKEAPLHPKAMPLMMSRWQMLANTGQSAQAKTEIETIAAGQIPDERKVDFAYACAYVEVMNRRGDVAAATTAVDSFIAAYPKDARGANLLSSLADARLTDAPTKLATYQRLQELYPDSPAAKRAEGKIRQADGIGKPFELSFTDAITGNKIDMTDLKGKVVVIDFWATWCGPCIAEMPKMKELYAKYKDQGVEFIGISLDQPEDKGGLSALKEYCKNNDIGWPQYYQGNFWASEFSTSWGINAIPALFIIDADGKLHSTEARGKLEVLIPELIAKRDGKGRG